MRNIKLAVVITSLIFTVSTLVVCLGLQVDNIEVKNSQVITLFLGALGIGVLTAIRIGLDHKKWMLKLSRFTKRFLFLPFYLVISVLTYFSIGYPFETNSKDLILYVSIFLLTFIIGSILKSISEKKSNNDFTEQINKYKKHLEEE